MGEVIDGRAIAAGLLAEVRAEVEALRARGIIPGLAVLLVGDDPGARAYVRGIIRSCGEVGVAARVVELPASTPAAEIAHGIAALNGDPAVHGILLQRPLPGPLRETDLAEAIDPAKDVDASNPRTVGRLLAGDPTFVPATPLAVQQILLRSGYSPEGRHVVIVGRSNIVGKPLAALLMQKAPGANATVTVCHSATQDLGRYTRAADIIVVAAGRPALLRASMVAPGAVVVDVGINRVPDPGGRGYRTVGDVAFEEVAPVAKAITPVPGGVGPVTLAMLLRNTVAAARAHETI